MMIDQPLRAQAAAGLLVGGEHEPDGPTRRHTSLRSRADHAQDHRVEVLHVHRAASPDAVVDDLTGERVHRPVVSMCGHDVQMAVEKQRRSGLVNTIRLPMRDQ